MTVNDATDRRPLAPTWLIATISGLTGLFFAYAVWNAIGNLVQAVQYYAAFDASLNALGWGIWIFAAVFPILVFAGAFWLGGKRRAWEFALVMLTGLALVAVFWLNVVAYTSVNAINLVTTA